MASLGLRPSRLQGAPFYAEAHSLQRAEAVEKKKKLKTKSQHIAACGRCAEPDVARASVCFPREFWRRPLLQRHWMHFSVRPISAGTFESHTYASPPMHLPPQLTRPQRNVGIGVTDCAALRLRVVLQIGMQHGPTLGVGNTASLGWFMTSRLMTRK